MFGWLKKREPELTYLVFTEKIGKYKYFISKLKEVGDQQQLWIFYHFEETGNEIKQLLGAAGLSYRESASAEAGLEVIRIDKLAEQLSGQMRQVEFNQVVVAELHPAGIRDFELLELIKTKDKEANVTYYTSMDSAVFRVFGGERMQRLMGTMGLDPDEPIRHAMINKSLQKAQKKIAEKLSNEQPADSEAQWLELNYPGG